MNSSNSILSMCMCADVLSTEYSRVHTMILQVWFGDMNLAKEKETWPLHNLDILSLPSGCYSGGQASEC